ncbi:conserved hypothetical protein [Culex quinquefasciatus]|uniref:MYND-type domain-containing protein n=1 Tax=Culex quinquefasciatus TaxID=7176 RepID=B0W7N0_CULQU|nr:conserved hypothetical protein [Culex quinquefasciatus]|eukprot:XP_001844714.1 conserved hypothetical protein [Culex quinquefasciatus]
MNVMKSCVLCHKPAELMCSRCFAFYCTMQCQIEDWEIHKKSCIALPKLVPNASYLSVLGVSRTESISAAGLGRMWQNNARALKPLRKPNIPLGTIEVSLDREATAKLTEPEAEPVSKEITVTTASTSSVADSVERVAKMKLQEVEKQQQVEVNGSGVKPQSLAKLKIDIIKNHQVNKGKVGPVVAAAAAPEVKVAPQQPKPWLLHFPIEKPVGEPFEVIVQCLVEIVNLSHPLEVNERIRIRMKDAAEVDGRKLVEIVQPPVTPYLLDMLGSAEDKFGEGGIIAILSSRTALVMVTSAVVKPTMKVLYNQLPELAPKQFLPLADKLKIGDLVCIETADDGWSRGLVVEQHDKNWLFYTVDNGTVELISDEKQIRALPEEYKQKPYLVLQMDLSRVIMKELEFKQRCYLPSFAFGFERLSYDQQTRTMKATLKDVEGKRQLAEVTFRNFVCDLKQVDINYWPHIPQDKSIVRITSVLDASTVIVCPKDKINVYTELLQTILPVLKQLTAPPKPNDVIVGVDELAMPYRARVLKVISANAVEVLDLDNGSIKTVPSDKLYGANGFIRNLPVYPMKVKIRDLDPAAVKNPELIIEQLQDLRSAKRLLKQLFESKSYMYDGVKLIDLNMNRSLGALLLENHDKKLNEAAEAERKKVEAEKLKREQEEEAARQAKAEAERKKRDQEAEIERQKAEQERMEAEKRKLAEEQAKAAAVAAAAADTTKLTYNDLKLVKLPAGTPNVKLSILDDSDVGRGIITVCVFNEENAAHYDKLDTTVNKIAATIGGDGYDPEVDELCVAIYDADKRWYRALCLTPPDGAGAFMVQFVDYGNVATVKRAAIRAMTPELNFSCTAHTCKLKDLESAKGKLGQQQQQQGYVVAAEIAMDGDVYLLKF